MRKLLRGLAWVAALVLIVGLIARALFVDVWTIPEDPEHPLFAASLAPTLAAGETVLLVTNGKPGFGDLVRCTDPEDPNAFVVGRIAGEAGDHVEVNGASLWVNQRRYEAAMACPEPSMIIPHPATGDDLEIVCDEVEMGGGHHYRGHARKHVVSSLSKADVGSGLVYLVSDNRDYHDDSRDFGMVPLSSCKGRIFFRVLGKEGWKSSRRLSPVR